MKTFFALIFCLAAGVGFAQTFTYPQIKKSGQTVNDFVPKGWTILGKAEGDLNGDKQADVALILQHKDSVTLINHIDLSGEKFDDTVVTQPRIQVVLFKTTGGLSLVAQNNSFVMTHDRSNMEDPYQEMKISKRVLEIDFQLFCNMGCSEFDNISYKFRYQHNALVLIGADYDSLSRVDENKLVDVHSFNFLTKRSYHCPKTGKAVWKKINQPQLKTLATLGKPLTWEVEKDFYL